MNSKGSAGEGRRVWLFEIRCSGRPLEEVTCRQRLNEMRGSHVDVVWKVLQAEGSSNSGGRQNKERVVDDGDRLAGPYHIGHEWGCLEEQVLFPVLQCAWWLPSKEYPGALRGGC